jgi:hypothetical protein
MENFDIFYGHLEYSKAINYIYVGPLGNIRKIWNISPLFYMYCIEKIWQSWLSEAVFKNKSFQTALQKL